MKRFLQKKLVQFFAGLARIAVRRRKPVVVGVTGSVGKTSTRMIVAQVLRRAFSEQNIRSSSKNFNGELGFSLAILGIEKYSLRPWEFLRALGQGIFVAFFGEKQEILVLEYGVDFPGEMEFLVSIVAPDWLIFTRVDAVHSEQFGDPDAIAAAERAVISAVKKWVWINVSDFYGPQFVEKFSSENVWKLWTRSQELGGTGVDLAVESEKIWEGSGQVAADFVLRIGDEKIEISADLPGVVHGTALGLGLAVAEQIFVENFSGKKLENSGEKWEEKSEHFLAGGAGNFWENSVAEKRQENFWEKNENFENFVCEKFLEKSSGKSGKIFAGKNLEDFSVRKFVRGNARWALDSQPGRCRFFVGKNGAVLLDSSYNAAPQSMRAILDLAWKLKKELFLQKKLVLVLGDMRELGDLAGREHRLLAGPASAMADEIRVVGERMARDFADELGKIGFENSRIRVFEESETLGEELEKVCGEGEVFCVFKGSQNTIFLEEAVKKVLENPADAAKLTRQDAAWRRKKTKFFEKKRGEKK